MQVVDRGHVGLAVHANDSHDALRVVNLGDQVQDDFARLLDRTRHVVVEVEVRQIHLLLLAHQRFAGHIARHLLRRIKDAQDGLKVVGNFGGRGHNADRWRFRLQSGWWWRWLAINVALLVTQHGRRFDVGQCPFVFVAFVLAFGHQPFGLGRQRDGFSRGRAPKVKHPLRVFGESNQAVFFSFAFDHHLGAVAWHDGNIFARPFLFLQDFHCGHLAPLYLFAK